MNHDDERDYAEEAANRALLHDDDNECEGHESLRSDMMGESYYCDGSCVNQSKSDISPILTFPLKPGDVINGCVVLISGTSTLSGRQGVLLAYRPETEEYVVSTYSDISLKSGAWHQGYYTRSFDTTRFAQLLTLTHKLT